MRLGTSIVVLGLPFLGLLACGHSADGQKHYPLTGKIVSIDTKAHTATIDAAAIPNYMDAMKMDYPITPADLASLKVGENISATVNVGTDGAYSLSDIHERPAAATTK